MEINFLKINGFGKIKNKEINLNKKINLRQDVDTSLLNDIDFTQIQFELKAKTDIIDMADGSVIYSAGTSIGKYNLQKDASLKIEDLPLGVYEIFECAYLKNLGMVSEYYST